MPPARTTLKLIADRLGLSVSTVSRALSGRGAEYRISQRTQRQVLALAQELNFAPNPLARGLRLKKTATIGLVIPDVSNPFFARIAHQVTVCAREQGYSIVLCDSQEQTEIERESLELLGHRQVEGLIVCPVGQADAHLRAWDRGETPVVLVDRVLPGAAIPAVVSDNRGGARAATRHLLENGHRRIACIQGLPETSPNDERLAGYREALAEYGLAVQKRWIVGDSFLEESGYRATRALLASGAEVTALFAFSNLLALGAIRALAEAGRTIPDDVSLVGFDDHPYAAYLATPLTTVAQDCDALGRLAFAWLWKQMRSGQRLGKRRRRVATELVRRGSVKPPRDNRIGASNPALGERAAVR